MRKSITLTDEIKEHVKDSNVIDSVENVQKKSQKILINIFSGYLISCIKYYFKKIYLDIYTSREKTNKIENKKMRKDIEKKRHRRKYNQSTEQFRSAL